MRVSKAFKADFDLVVRHFRLAELGELEDAKEAVRRSPETAAICFAEMGRWVRDQSRVPNVATTLPIKRDPPA
jgi:hypothetical protein